MPTLKIACLFILLFFIQISLPAQEKLNIKFGKVKVEDFDVKSLLIDSNTNAVVVADVGNSQFIANSSDLTFSLLFKQKKRIKIINKNGFDAATITIPLYVGSNGRKEELEDLDAYTYNLENGKVVETKVAKSSVFTEKQSKNWIYKKFTFPAIKEGSIIEYSYEVKSDFFTNLQPWTFQGEYPVLWSQYEADIPDFFKYVTLSQGYHSFYINDIKNAQTSFSFTEHVELTPGTGAQRTNGTNSFKIEGTIAYHNWIMKDVPALKEEAYTTTVKNSVSKIEFQLKQVAFPNTLPRDYMNTWEKVAKELMEDDQFGLPISRPNNWLDDDAARLVKSAASQKDKAQLIYEFVRDNFTHNDHYGIYLPSSLKEVYKNKNGSIAEINMLLIALLKNQNIVATPVILSTRSNGYTHEYYPLMDRYNYVIAKVEVDNNQYYLDASVHNLGFGKLPTRVYNGQAREINKENAVPVYFAADSVKESTNTYVFIFKAENGNLEGSFTKNPGVFETMKLRNKMAGTSFTDYTKSLQQQYPEEIILSNISIDSLKSLKNPVSLKYDLTFKTFGEDDIVYFNPMMSEAMAKNPFSVAQRFYPVEMSYTIDEIYTLDMEIPKGYKVDELPKSVRYMFNDNEGMFEYIISSDKETIKLKRRLVLNKATFVNEDYPSLRELFTFIVKKEAEQIVFKKIK